MTFHSGGAVKLAVASSCGQTHSNLPFMICRTCVGRLFCLSNFSYDVNFTGPKGVIRSVLSRAARILAGLNESARFRHPQPPVRPNRLRRHDSQGQRHIFQYIDRNILLSPDTAIGGSTALRSKEDWRWLRLW